MRVGGRDRLISRRRVDGSHRAVGHLLRHARGRVLLVVIVTGCGGGRGGEVVLVFWGVRRRSEAGQWGATVHQLRAQRVVRGDVDLVRNIGNKNTMHS
jgi:hypothetical protein